MSSVTIKLRELRKSAAPRITVRRMAELLDMPLGTYARYESEGGYKKPFLPMDFTRRVAAVLSDYKVDPAEVMKLAGLTDGEVEPEAREIEAQKPTQFCVTLPVILPSEAALRDMFRSLLVMVPDGASKDEVAEILARRLPSGLAAIGPVLLDPVAAVSIAGEADPQVLAKAHPEAEQGSRT
ncbi:hypothetical protein [Novosphingobium mathurense]|uniref:hypothetical protein n=1 Tax=Novosphingobium mathurense TaxID=428990 RepID=UPI0009A8182F|nr:hypothetical protein [Novosphingobium mathurense]